jgi:hypothetical protein
MTEWLVRLRGQRSDLEDLSEWLTSSDLNVRKEDDHFYLRCSEFEPLTDADDVRGRATELLDIINGASMLRSGSYLPVELDTVAWIDEEGKLRLLVGSSVTARWPVLAAQSPTGIESLVTLAREDKKVADILHFFQKGDWHGLYKAWELVGDAVGGEHKLKKQPWVDERAKRRFTQTAQSREVLGDAARHASEDYDKPIRGRPMTLDEARGFVKFVIESWVATL